MQRAKQQQQKTRSLVARDGEICIHKGGKFTSCTNFTINIVCAVESPPQGPAVSRFVYRMRTVLSEDATETRYIATVFEGIYLNEGGIIMFKMKCDSSKIGIAILKILRCDGKR